MEILVAASDGSLKKLNGDTSEFPLVLGRRFAVLISNEDSASAGSVYLSFDGAGIDPVQIPAGEIEDPISLVWDLSTIASSSFGCEFVAMSDRLVVVGSGIAEGSTFAVTITKITN